MSGWGLDMLVCTKGFVYILGLMTAVTGLEFRIFLGVSVIGDWILVTLFANKVPFDAFLLRGLVTVITLLFSRRFVAFP